MGATGIDTGIGVAVGCDVGAGVDLGFGIGFGVGIEQEMGTGWGLNTDGLRANENTRQWG